MAIRINKIGISHDELLRILDYDPDTGMFRWKIRIANRINAGTIAGWIKKYGYRQIMIKGKSYFAHRLAFFYVHGYDSENELDHIDGDTSNNRIKNLRESSRSCNMQNKQVYKNNTTGVHGVYFSKHKKKYAAQITTRSNQKHIGYFVTILDAAKARYDAEIKYGFNKCQTDSSALKYIKAQG